MLIKIYDNVKNFLIKNKLIVFMVLFYFIMMIPMPYYIFAGGGTINVADRFEIDIENKTEGSFNLSYVSEIKGTVFTYLLSYIIPSWEKEPISKYKITEEESLEDLEKRDKLFLEYGNEVAVKTAYELANKDIRISNYYLNVIFIDELVKANIKVGDTVLKADDIVITDIDTYKDVVTNKEVGEYVKLELKRGEKIVVEEVLIQNIDDVKMTGLGMLRTFDYKVTPEIEFKFKKSETGSSGGLMLTLAIYNSLIKDDITNGLKIVGTGTIEENGAIGEIGGVKYKLMGAIKAKADVFLVPSGDNYEECIKVKKEKGYDIKIIEVTTIKEAIEKLSNL